MLEALIAYRRLLGETEEEIEPLDPEQMKRDQAALRERKVNEKKARDAHRKKMREALDEKARIAAMKAEERRLAEAHKEAIRRAKIRAAAQAEAKAIYEKALAEAGGEFLRKRALPTLTDKDIEAMRGSM